MVPDAVGQVGLDDLPQGPPHLVVVTKSAKWCCIYILMAALQPYKSEDVGEVQFFFSFHVKTKVVQNVNRMSER